MIQPRFVRSLNFVARRLSQASRLLRYYYWRIVRLKGSPEYIARGVSAGVFAGCFPLFGLQTVLGVVIAIIARGHKLCAAGATWISNPLTYVPIYWLNFQVGRYLLGSSVEMPSDWDSIDAVLSETGEVLADLLVGCAIVGTFLAFASYFGSLRLVRWWRFQHQLQRRSLREQRQRRRRSPATPRLMSYHR